MPNVRAYPPSDSNPKPIEIEELSLALRTSILSMNEPELEAFTDALAVAFLSIDDIQRLSRFVIAKVDSAELYGGESDV